ncbi:hypothetical protein RDABS01_034155 [Bienertia sinuspersici]
MIEGSWNAQLIEEVLSPWEAGKVLSIPLPMFPCDDMWVWKYTRHGLFSVKSAYHLVVQEGKSSSASSSLSQENSLWKKVCNASVPPKVRTFAWKAIHSALPVGKKIG